MDCNKCSVGMSLFKSILYFWHTHKSKRFCEILGGNLTIIFVAMNSPNFSPLHR